jgi:hypothetical protein
MPHVGNMKQKVTLLNSNNAAFPAGVRVWAIAEHGQLTKLATLEVEDVTYFRAAQRVDVRTALGYQFSISTEDYDRLMAE